MKTLDVLSFGAGGAGLVMALTLEPDMLKCINKVAFVEGQSLIGTALAYTTKKSELKGNAFWAVSPLIHILERKAIMFQIGDAPIGSIIKKTSESACACPVISVCRYLRRFPEMKSLKHILCHAKL